MNFLFVTSIATVFFYVPRAQLISRARIKFTQLQARMFMAAGVYQRFQSYIFAATLSQYIWDKPSALTPLQLMILSPLEYARDGIILFSISSSSQAGDSLFDALASPAHWSVELIRCTLLGGTAARGENNHYVANGSTVFVTKVSVRRMEVVEEERKINEEEDWVQLRGELLVPRDAMLPFHFSAVAVYVSSIFLSFFCPIIRHRCSNWFLLNSMRFASYQPSPKNNSTLSCWSVDCGRY